MTLEERARELGITVSQLKAQLKRKQEAQEQEKARQQLNVLTGGWNPRAGNRKRHKGF